MKKQRYEEKVYQKFRNKEISYAEMLELLEQHERKLESKRKYKQGREITNLEELLNQEIVFMFGKPMNIEVVKSQTLRTILQLIETKRIFIAVKK